MRQPRAVLIAERRFSANGVCVAIRGDLARADRRMNARRGRRNLGAPLTLAERQSMEGASASFSSKQGEMRNACNLHRWVGELELRPGRDLVELGRAGARRRHSDGCPTRPDGRSGALARLSPSALVVAAPPASSLVVLTPKGGPGEASARSAHPMAIAGRVSRSTAAMKLARASASLMLRGSST